MVKLAFIEMLVLCILHIVRDYSSDIFSTDCFEGPFSVQIPCYHVK